MRKEWIILEAQFCLIHNKSELNVGHFFNQYLLRAYDVVSSVLASKFLSWAT
jgi:hypothetical protein